MFLSSFQVSFLLAGELQRIGMGPSSCSLGACSVLVLGACARLLKSEHMLGSLVLGLDARRVLGEHQRITE